MAAAKKAPAKKAEKTAEKTRDKVVLAYSGGLDTSVAIRWLQEQYDVDVIAIALNLGQPPSSDDIVARALRNGAIKADFIDVRDEFVDEYVWPSLKANALYQNVYPLSTAIGRPLIAKKLVEIAQQEGAKYIAHGCTGKGNDQVRFDVGIVTLDPSLKVIAPMREWHTTREEEIDYAKKNGIEIIVKKESPYSRDENLWGSSCECGVLEDPWAEPPKDAWENTVDPEDAPDEPTYLTLEFEKGAPVALNGEKMKVSKIIEGLNELGGKNGIGILDIVENRLVGMKDRGVYETPGGTILYFAHEQLEMITVDKDTLHAKQKLAVDFADLIYNGKWFSPLREALSAFADKANEYVTGTVKLKLYKGNIIPAGMTSPYSLYSEDIATFNDSAFDYDQKDSAGFINLWGLPDTVQALREKGLLNK